MYSKSYMMPFVEVASERQPGFSASDAYFLAEPTPVADRTIVRLASRVQMLEVRTLNGPSSGSGVQIEMEAC